MGCNCGTPAGFERRFQYIVGREVMSEHDTQAEANAAKANAGGAGRVQRITRKLAGAR